MNMRKISLLFFVSALASLAVYTCDSQEFTSAKLYLKQQNWEKAEQFLKQAEGVEPQNPEIPYLLGAEIYARRDNYEKMNEAFNRSLAISNQFKSNIDITRLKLWQEKFIQKGGDFYNKAIKIDDPDQRQELFLKAISNFKDAIQIIPDSADVYFFLGETYREIDSLQQAKEVYENGIDKAPQGDIKIHKQYANLLLQAPFQDTSKAVNVLQDARTYNPEDISVLKKLADLYLIQNKFEKSINMYQAVIKKEPENPDFYFNLGLTYQRIAISKQMDDESKLDTTASFPYVRKAIDAFEKTAALDSSDVVAKAQIAKNYLLLGKNQKAIEMYEVYLKEHPDNLQLLTDYKEILRSIAEFYNEHENQKQAEKYYEKLMQITTHIRELRNN